MARKKVGDRKVEVGNIRDVSGEVNVAGRDIINNIQTIYERALTPAETTERELNIEIKELARGVQGYLKRLKQQITKNAGSVPYKGLDAYSLSESSIFFGRDRAIRDMCDAIERGALTVLQAESGAGKTSLLQAGLIPQVIAKKNLAILIRSQFENPTDSIKKIFIGNLELTPKLAKAPLVDFLRRVKGILGHRTTLYLILDQFEEFFSKTTLDQDRQEFIAELAACLNDTTLNVRWVISITTDVFGQLGKFEPYIQNPFSNVESLYLFNRSEAAEVIAKPAQLHGLSFEEGLLEQLIDDLDHDHNELIAPTQIQLVCAALYDDIKDRSKLFTRALYAKNGGVQGILHEYIGGVLSRKLPPEERIASYKILEALVTSEKRRIIRGKNDLEIALKNTGIAPETVQSTLDHLVARRLLRRLGDDAEHIQYEIVHDYLLKEIEINDDVRNTKEAEELLDYGVRNWERQKLLLAPDVLKILENRAADIPISSAAAKLLFLSAIEYNRPSERWGKLISAAERKSIIDSLLTKKSDRKNREALWSLRSFLTSAQRTRLTFIRSSLATFTLIFKGIIIFLIGTALFILGVNVIDSTLYFVPWTEVTSLNTQCLDGRSPSGLLVAIDGAEASHVIAYDSRSQILCETSNTGAGWRQVEGLLPANLTINSIAVNSGVYLATNRGLYYHGRDAVWKNLGPTPESQFALQEISISFDNRDIFVTTDGGILYRYKLKTGEWIQEALPQDMSGKITDLTSNYDYLAISTEDGIWYREMRADGSWQQYILSENVTITALEMVHPVYSRNHEFIDPTDVDWFLAATEQGEIYFGYLTETDGLQKMDGQPPIRDVPIFSLAVNDYSKFVAGSSQLYCEQSWVISDPEWWLTKFSRNHPCE